ncbi:MAG: hypothetical protein HYR85_02170 [Planctomycetes bacterium]|nr:hypothetical protein [Planctomycetota bacterium]MBI3848399.1 hypothetical protein [Planctomycetota bacterium]
MARNVADAALVGLSPDNKFGLAYDAVLLLSKMAIACAGYRVKGQGAHRTTFEALQLALGPTIAQKADYFDRCRRKRNEFSYDVAGVVSAREAQELLEHTRQFEKTVEAWIAKHHPTLTR